MKDNFSKRAAALLALLATVAATGCAFIPDRVARNEARCPADARAGRPVGCAMGAPTPAGNEAAAAPAHADAFRAPRARESFSPQDTDTPPVFVGLALSGGGSRAANYAMAAMEQLDALGLMRHVTAISATSGGGVAGAYYAVHGLGIDWAQARQAMGQDFGDPWLKRVLKPRNLVSTVALSADRTDLMAGVFDELLLKGTTYGQLGALAPGRPIFIANATDSMEGQRFSFTSESFAALGSRIDTYPLAQAVAASAAFPGAFNAVTLKKYPHAPASQPLRYVHLIDGGATDNLGIEALLTLAQSHATRQAPARPAAAPGCFIFIVDAFPAGIKNRKALMPDPRSTVDHAFDTNFIDALDVLLMQRRTDLLAYMGLGHPLPAAARPPREIRVAGLYPQVLEPVSVLVDVDVPRWAASGKLHTRVRPVLTPLGTVAQHQEDAAPPVPVADGFFRCTAWHIDLGGLLAIEPAVEAATAATAPPSQVEGLRQRQEDMLRHRAALKLLVDQTQTDWKLKGPPHCPASLVQDALYAAAFVAVREDDRTRRAVCRWFASAGLATAGACGVFPGNPSTALRLKLRAATEGPGGIDPPDSEVQCAPR